MNGAADSKVAEWMIHRGTLLESDLNVDTFFCRVPTFSNIADGPSRHDFTMCERIGASRVSVPSEMLRACAIPA